MTDYEGKARVKPSIICQMSSREGRGAPRSLQTLRSDPCDTREESLESSVGVMSRKRQRGRSRDRLMKTPSLWGGHEHRGSRNGSPRAALSSLFPCGPVQRNTSNNNNAAIAPTPAQLSKTCDESESRGVKDEPVAEGILSFSESPPEEEGKGEIEEVALRAKSHSMALLSYRGISEDFLSFLDESTYEDSSDEYKRKHGPYGLDNIFVLGADDLYSPAEEPMLQGRKVEGVCDECFDVVPSARSEFSEDNVVHRRAEPEVARRVDVRVIHSISASTA